MNNMEKYMAKCQYCGMAVERSVNQSRPATCFSCRIARDRKNAKAAKVLEKDIQREICDWLFEKGYFFWRSNNVPVFAMSGSGFKRFLKLPKYTPRGIPDILCVHKGKFIGLEVKRPDSPSRTGNRFQEEFGRNIVEHGGVYKVVYSLNDVREMPDLR